MEQTERIRAYLVQRSVVERLIWIDDSPSLLLLALAKEKRIHLI